MSASSCEAKPYHTGRIARTLRAAHRELLTGMGVNIHRELRAMFDASMWTRAWFLDGELMAIGGVTGTALSTEGVIWLALSEAATHHPLRLAREVKRQFAVPFLSKHRLLALVMKDDAAALRFAYFLGFKLETAEIVNGAEALVMICERSS